MTQAHALAASTVGRWMRRLDPDRLAVLEPAAPIRRDEHEAAGDLLHLDIKRLGHLRRPGHRVTGSRQLGKSAGAGWECVHVEWAYARSHDASAQRTQHLDSWLHAYNGHRPHASLSSERRGSASDLDHRVPARAESITSSGAYCPSVDMYCASA